MPTDDGFSESHDLAGEKLLATVFGAIGGLFLFAPRGSATSDPQFGVIEALLVTLGTCWIVYVLTWPPVARRAGATPRHVASTVVMAAAFAASVSLLPSAIRFIAEEGFVLQEGRDLVSSVRTPNQGMVFLVGLLLPALSLLLVAFSAYRSFQAMRMHYNVYRRRHP